MDSKRRELTVWEKKRKSLRNYLYKFNAHTVISFCLKHLKEFDIEGLCTEGWYIPHELLGLLRLVVLHHYDDEKKDLMFSLRQEQKDAGQNDFSKILNKYKDLYFSIAAQANIENKFKTHQDFLRFLQTTSHQQLWWQEKTTIFDIARLDYFFEEKRLAELFYECFGFNFQDFFRCVTIFLVCLHEPAHIFDLPQLKGYFPELDLEKFINLFSVEVTSSEEVREKVQKSQFKNELYFYLEKSPFARYPFLKISNTFFLTSKVCFKESIKNIIYMTIKEKHGQNFTNVFTQRFENYISWLLDLYGINFIDEDDLSKRFPSLEKKVDFLIETENSVILIEAKGMALHPLAQVIQDAKIYRDKIKDSIIDGFIQLQTVAGNKEFGKAFNGKPVFGFIVTYKDFYAGPFPLLHPGLLVENNVIRNSNFENADTLPLPLSNIQSFGIETLERVVQAIAGEKEKFEETLQESAKVNSIQNFLQVPFSFSQIIGKVPAGLQNPVVNARAAKYFDYVREQLNREGVAAHQC